MSAFAIPSQKILIVNDEPEILHLYAEILKSYGYLVDTVLDGESAWLELLVENYDLIITDNWMPKMTGMDLIRVLRDAKLTTPVIMSTATPPEAKFVLESWLQPFLVLEKPHEIEQLLAAVGELLLAPPAIAA